MNFEIRGRQNDNKHIALNNLTWSYNKEDVGNPLRKGERVSAFRNFVDATVQVKFATRDIDD